MEENIAVSIVCAAYNHEKYIGRCLESFVTQKTSFPFEVIVNDDASTDGTAEVIREYAEKYPDIIKPIYQQNNVYSTGVPMIVEIFYPLCRGKYIAICEGDDFWTDSGKLQRQYDILEAHPECDMCAHGAEIVDESGENVIDRIHPADRERILTAEEVILGDGGFISTNSLFYRSDLIRNIPKYFAISGYDYALQIQGAVRGGIYYLPEDMSAYRFMSVGSWTQNTESSKSKRIKLNNHMEEMLRLADEDTGGKFHGEFLKMQKTFAFNTLWVEGNFKAMIGKEYRDILAGYTPFAKLKIYLRAYFPFLKKLKH